MTIRPDNREGVNRLADEKSQSQRFEKLARELEADEDEARWEERLRKVARHKPAPEPEKPDAT